jgi:uncharacterized membrane protein
MTYSSSSSGSPIGYVDMPWQTYRSFYIHVRPPSDAARGSNLNMALTLQSDNNSVAQESFHLDCYANWIIPADTTQTVTTETIADMQYSVKVWGDLVLDDVQWTFNNYPQAKEIIIYDGGMGDFNDITITTTDTSDEWRFFVYGDMELTNSDIAYTDYGIEVYSQDYPANVLIDGNTIHDSDHDGLTLEESYAVITNNVFEDNAHSGLHGFDSYGSALIKGNTFRGNSEGILMELKSADQVQIINNTFYSNNEGLRLDSFSEVYTYNNIMHSNNYGIQVYSHADLESHDDLLMMNSMDGLMLDSYATGVCYDLDSLYNARAGIWITYRSELAVYTSAIAKNGQFALYAANSDVWFRDSSLYHTAIHHVSSGSFNNDDGIRLDNKATVVATNVTFDRSRLYFSDLNSSLTVQWYLQVQTVDIDDVGIEDMQVIVKDEQDNQVFDGPTETDGLTPVMVTKEVTILPGTNINYMNHEITVSNGVDIVEDIYLDNNQIEIIKLNYVPMVSAKGNEILDRPSETVSFNLLVTNMGMLDDTFDLEVNGNITWKPVLDLTTVSILSGESSNLTLNVTIPQMALAWVNETFEVTATSQGDASSMDSVEVYCLAIAVNDIKIVPVHETFNTTPGNNLYSVFEVTNTGNVPLDTYDFSAKVSGEVLGTPTITVEPTSADMIAWETITVIVNTSVAAGTLVGIDYLTLNATNANLPVSKEATVSLIVDQVYDADLDRPETVDIVAGNIETFDLTLTNIGNGPDVLDIYSDSEYLSFDVDLVRLAVDEGAEFQMSVTIPLDTDTSVEHVHIIADSADNLTSHWFNITLNITARDPNIEIITPFDAIELEQGFLKTFDVTLSNLGNTREEPVLEYSGVSWSGAFEEEILFVALDGTETTQFSFQIPEGETLGDYDLVLSATYSGVVSTKTITVTVIGL